MFFFFNNLGCCFHVCLFRSTPKKGVFWTCSAWNHIMVNRPMRSSAGAVLLKCDVKFILLLLLLLWNLKSVVCLMIRNRLISVSGGRSLKTLPPRLYCPAKWQTCSLTDDLVIFSKTATLWYRFLRQGNPVASALLSGMRTSLLWVWCLCFAF